MNSMKRQKDRALNDEIPRLVGAQYAGEEWRNNSRKNEESQSKNNAQFWMLLVMEVRTVKNNAVLML